MKFNEQYTSNERATHRATFVAWSVARPVARLLSWFVFMLTELLTDSLFSAHTIFEAEQVCRAKTSPATFYHNFNTLPYLLINEKLPLAIAHSPRWDSCAIIGDCI